MGPLAFKEVPGGLRLEAAGEVLEEGADPGGAVVTLTWGPESFSKVAVVNKAATGVGTVATGALAFTLVKVEGFGVFSLELALDSTVPSAANRTGEPPESRVGPGGGEGAFSCLQLLGPVG